MSFPGDASGKEPACQCRRCKRCGFDPWIRKIPRRRAWKLTPVFLPGEPHGAWRATVHSFTRSQTRLKGLSMHAHTHTYFFLPKSYYKCTCLPGYWASQVVPVVKNPPASAGDVRDVGSIPGLGRSPGGTIKRRSLCGEGDQFSTTRCPRAVLGFPGGATGKEPACQCRRCKRCGFTPWLRKIPWRRAWQPTPMFLPNEHSINRGA